MLKATDELELLTEIDRVRLVAALGLMIYRSPEIDPQRLELLLSLSDPEAQIWVQK